MRLLTRPRSWRAATWPIRSARIRATNRLRLVGLDPVVGPSTHQGVTTRLTPQTSEVPIVMCVWQRLDRLEPTIASLAAQTHTNLRLHIWNNNRHARATVDAIVGRSDGLPIDVVHSDVNVGGFGRFYVARALAPSHPHVIFVDDDVLIPPTMVERFLAEARPREIRSFWAFTFVGEDYWTRRTVLPGERADYCGTGGMVADSSVFLDRALYRCPKRFWFVEDLWLCYYASHVLGWDLRRSFVELRMEEDEVEQFMYLRRQKSAMLRHLLRSGWTEPGSGSLDPVPSPGTTL